jgi:hypothetical protein
LRQEPTLERLKERIENDPALEGAILIGSLATGAADDLSDIDVLVVVAEGRFEEVWSARHTLDGGEAIVAWDDVEPGREGIGGRKWLTRDLVFVECLLATPSSGVRLAGPYRLLAGSSALPDELDRRGQFTRDELDAYARDRVAAGRTHEIETAYGALVRAVRSVRSVQ